MAKDGTFYCDSRDASSYITSVLSMITFAIKISSYHICKIIHLYNITRKLNVKKTVVFDSKWLPASHALNFMTSVY